MAPYCFPSEESLFLARYKSVVTNFTLKCFKSFNSVLYNASELA